MKANKIQIGDWLYYKGQFNAFPFKVESITKKKVGYHAEPNGHRMYYLRLSECKPIPLTPEILEKNGIDWDCGCGYFKEDKHYILELFKGVDNKIDWSINLAEYTIMRIEYVHQLQNTIRVCGIEKEIIL